MRAKLGIIKKTLFSFLIFIIFIQQCCSLKCWVCCSEADPECADPFDNSTFQLKDCHRRRFDGTLDPRQPICTKIKQRVDGKWQYIRSCGVLDEIGVEREDTVCKTRTYPGDVLVEYCSCISNDGCNG